MSFLDLHKFLTDCTTKRGIAGCVCWVGDDRHTHFFRSYGYAQIVPERAKITKDTIFDIASLTKPIVTAVSVMLLYEGKKVKLNEKIRKYLPGFKKKINGEKTIKDLLTHTAGLPAWFPLYLLPEDRRMIHLAETNTKTKHVVYSCLGYILLGMIVEKISGCSLAAFCSDNIIRKIGLRNTMFGPVKRKQVAATEFGNKHEKKAASRYGNVSRVDWRKSVIKGEVHDGNSFYAFKGMSGNAGLFSNARDLVRFLRHYLAGGIVRQSTMMMMIRDHTGGADMRGLGWVLNPYPRFLSASSFFHTGFTGAMCFADPESNLITILLTNAVHPRVRLTLMPSVRRQVMRIVSKTLQTSRKQ